MLASARAHQGIPHAATAPERHDARNCADVAAPADMTHLRPASAEIELSVVTTRAGLQALETEWNTLFRECARDIHVFQSFNWIWHWANHFLRQAGDLHSSSGLYIVTGRRGGRLVLICPLVRNRRWGITSLSFAGEPVSQYGDVLLDEQRGGQELLAQAWSFIAHNSGADVLMLRKVRADSNLASFLAHSQAMVTEREIAPFLDLASAPDPVSYEQRYSSKARKNRRRLLRRLEERGPASVNVHTGGQDGADMAALAVSLKRAWLKHRGLISPALAKPATRAFFAAVGANSERPVGAVITHLSSRGELAAIEVSFDCKGRRAVHIIVYALKFERLSVGQILMERSVRNAITSGQRVYDLMAPGDAYKLDWADGSVDVVDWAHALTPRGRAFARFYLGYARGKLKSAVKAASGIMRQVTNRDTKTDPTDPS